MKKRKKRFNQKQKLSVIEKGAEIGISEAAEVAGVNASTVYDWKNQLEALGKDAFLAYTPAHPGRGIKIITEQQEKSILKVWKQNPGYGPGQVRSQLRRQGITISIGTVKKVLKSNGYTASQKKKKPECHRYEASRPLELSQMDILEQFINKLKVYIVLLIDDYSRFILNFKIVEETSIDSIIELVDHAVQRYGKMGELLTDRGFVFYSWRGVNRFEKYLEFSGIDHIHARPHHPQTLGKVEALNRRIQGELFRQNHFTSLGHAMAEVKKWVEHYNYHRPHQGIGGLLAPGERFHGQSEQVLDKITRGENIDMENSDIERNILTINRMPNGRIVLKVMGQNLIFQGEQNA